MSRSSAERIQELVTRSRIAQESFVGFDQRQVDDVIGAIGWLFTRPGVADRLARLEAEETGMGNATDKTVKIRNRIRGSLSEMIGKRSVGVMDDDPVTGIVRIAKPKGVFAALTPSTNMVAGTVQTALCILKGRNSVIFSPQPRAKHVAQEVSELLRKAVASAGAAPDIVLNIDEPTRELRDLLMQSTDVVMATGGEGVIRAAYKSGRPAIGAGPGNLVAIIDEDYPIDDAVARIVAGKTFDHATSCSAENAVLIPSKRYDEVMQAFAAHGAYRVAPQEREQLRAVLWEDGRLNDRLICRPPSVIAERAQLSPSARDARLLIVEETGIGPAHRFSGEKLSVVLAVYRYDDFDSAIALLRSILAYQGRGHSCAIHTNDDTRALQVAQSADVCRVLVNQSGSSSGSGSFTNGLGFTSVLGCGSWGGNALDHNVTWEDCINITRMARPTAERPVGDAEFFDDLLRRRPELAKLDE